MIPLGDITKHNKLVFLKYFHSESENRKDNILKVLIMNNQRGSYLLKHFYRGYQKLLYQVRLEKVAAVSEDTGSSSLLITSFHLVWVGKKIWEENLIVCVSFNASSTIFEIL